MAQLSKNPNQLTRSENLRIEEAVAELNAEFEYLRQRLRKQVEEADVDGAEYTAASDGHDHEPDRDHAGRATRRSEGDILNETKGRVSVAAYG